MLASRIAYGAQAGRPRIRFEHSRRDRVGLADLIQDYEAVWACIRATPSGHGVVDRFEDVMQKFDLSISRIVRRLELGSVVVSSGWQNSDDSSKHQITLVSKKVLG